MRKFKKSTSALLALALILSVGVGSTLAFLMDTDEPIKNIFNPGSVPPVIQENEPSSENNYVKSNVFIKNDGTVSAFIRVAIVASWQKTVDGQTILAKEEPKLDDEYVMKLVLTNDGWFYCESDGYYYYKNAVPAGQSTTTLIEEAYAKTAPEGYQLHLEIVTSTIQSDYSGSNSHPAAAKWGVTVNGTTISKN